MATDADSDGYRTAGSDDEDGPGLLEVAAYYKNPSIAGSSSLSSNSLKTTITILFSEAGRTQFFAVRLWESLSNIATHMSIKQIDYFNFESLLDQKNVLIIITSIVGKNGDPPENAKDFWDKLRQQQDMDLCDKLSQLHFAVFGLGSKVYQTFASFPVNLDQLLSFYATRLQPIFIGQADAFNQWCLAIKSSVADLLQREATESAVTKPETELDSVESVDISDITASCTSLSTPCTRYEHRSSSPRIAVLSESKSSFMIRGGNAIEVPDAISRIHEHLDIVPMKILSKLRLLPKKNVLGQQIVLIRMTVSQTIYSASLDFEPGDCLGIFPSNPIEDVDLVLSRVPDIVKYTPSDDNYVLVDPVVITKDTRLPACSLREALTYYLEICECPSQELLGIMSSYARIRLHSERLRYLADVTDAYESWRKAENPTFSSLLRDFSSLRIPPEELLTNLPLLQPRLFSICSSRSLFPNQIHVVVDLGRWSKTGITGVCSLFLSSVSKSKSIPCFLLSSPNFRMPEDMGIPIIMIASGVGIAPFRAFLQHRQNRLQEIKEFSVKQRTSPNQSLVSKIFHLGTKKQTVNQHTDQRKVVGETILFYGCKNHRVDALFRSEIDDWIKDETLSYFFLASANGDGNRHKKVEEDVWCHRDLVHSLVKFEQATIYVSGDEKTLITVREKLAKIFTDVIDQASSSQSGIQVLRRRRQYFENCVSLHT